VPLATSATISADVTASRHAVALASFMGFEGCTPVRRIYAKRLESSSHK
jgi:hypothetical protein